MYGIRHDEAFRIADRKFSLDWLERQSSRLEPIELVQTIECFTRWAVEVEFGMICAGNPRRERMLRCFLRALLVVPPREGMDMAGVVEKRNASITLTDA